LFVSSLEL